MYYQNIKILNNLISVSWRKYKKRKMNQISEAPETIKNEK